MTLLSLWRFLFNSSNTPCPVISYYNQVNFLTISVCMVYLFHPFSFNLSVSFFFFNIYLLNEYFMGHLGLAFFLSCLNNFCLLIGACNPLPFNIIIMICLESTILLFIFWMFHLLLIFSPLFLIYFGLFKSFYYFIILYFLISYTYLLLVVAPELIIYIFQLI